MHSVMVVDDDPALRRVVTSWVESFGYESSEAESAEDAVEKLAEAPADIAVCDVNRSASGGVWLASHIRELLPAHGHHHGQPGARRRCRHFQPAQRRRRLPAETVRPRTARRSAVARARLAPRPAPASTSSSTCCMIGSGTGAPPSPLRSPTRRIRPRTPATVSSTCCSFTSATAAVTPPAWRG